VLLTLLKVYELVDQLLHRIASCGRRLRCSGVVGGGHGGCELVGAAEQGAGVAHKGRGDLGEVSALRIDHRHECYLPPLMRIGLPLDNRSGLAEGTSIVVLSSPMTDHDDRSYPQCVTVRCVTVRVLPNNSLWDQDAAYGGAHVIGIG
jgi:hypothetical protein